MTMQRRTSDSKARLTEKVVSAAKSSGRATAALDTEAFIRQYYHAVSAEDLRERRSADLAVGALSHLQLALQRKAGESNVRVVNPARDSDGWTSSHSVLQVVTDDRAFLVDSLGAAINQGNLSVHLTIHPVLRVQRDEHGRLVHVYDHNETGSEVLTESFVQIEFDRVTDTRWLATLRQRVLNTLQDVRAATDDWRAMLEQSNTVRERLRREAASTATQADIDEACALLEWMTQENYTFLGYREYRLERDERSVALVPIAESGLGILRGPGTKVMPSESPAVDRAIRKEARSNDIVIITKANSRSTVHRPAHLDYIGVKSFDDQGRVIGEMRFLGLFTSVAYSRSPRNIPILRRKVETIVKRSGIAPTGHRGKALLHILEHYPRDELFQTSIEDLMRIVDGILSLQERQRVKLFVRRDAFRRFFACMVFAPREKYNTQVRERIEEILLDGLHGTAVESEVQLSDSKLARLHIIVRTSPETSSRVSLKAVEERIVNAVRTWQDGLRDELIERLGEEQGLILFHTYGRCFPAAYEEDVSAREATFDVERIDRLRDEPDGLQMSLYRPPDFDVTRARFKIFHRAEPIPLSQVLPMLENMGLDVISERPYRVDIGDNTIIWVQDFEMTSALGEALQPAEVNELFQDAFARTWRGEVEDDGFNKLTLIARFSWRQAMLLRAYCRYLLQTGLPFSQTYMEEVVLRNLSVARCLLEEFFTRFDPELSEKRRTRLLEACVEATDEALETVNSADEDRILRGFIAAMRATLRTNFYQSPTRAQTYVSFKLDPAKIPDLPRPLPWVEIWVYSPRVEGVHLRGGRVARGGLRWSDRREDFRTEVLGLMKAQKVKNTLIVPTGAKGGFVCKQLPLGKREEVMNEVVSCYRQFISGLLDLTDNLVDGQVVPPERCVRKDEDDTYLVVAADKGTATFSDIANAVAKDYGFWLGDAFASGGSVGYDHKRMGITAKGGWEAVKRHFRELGVNVQTEPFTAVAIGDMAGDVFGNGMLRSPTTRLVAAFNHLHIFIDPNPQAAASFAERQRLFELPRSSWEDYDRSLISKGGGVFSRESKRIAVTGPMRKALGLDVKIESMTPNGLIKAILCAPVDLLWNGGIGTYVKSAGETHGDVGDRNNDTVRVDGRDLRCKVVGEGGNLGLTQKGRVEYALNDGRINTDFIDNAGGVNCSDREVNIKILLDLVTRTGELSLDKRNVLLASMTDEVEELVLRDNYLQTLALSVTESEAAMRANEHAHMIRELVQSGELDRDIEFLPGDKAIRDRYRNSKGLTRPELSVLLSYSKISVYDELVRFNLTRDKYLAGELSRYFPEPLRKPYRQQMKEHPLAREIIATQITNSLLNRMGPTFLMRTREETSAPVEDIARAFAIARESYDMRSLWNSIEELDNVVGAGTQYKMLAQTTRLLRRASTWLLNRQPELDVATQVARFQPGITVLATRLPSLIVDAELQRYRDAESLYLQLGVGQRLAGRLAGLASLNAGFDIVEVAEEVDREVIDVAQVYYALGTALHLDWTRDQIERLEVTGRWHALARTSLRENVDDIQRDITVMVMQAGDAQEGRQQVESWLGEHATSIERVTRVLKDMRGTDHIDFATLSVAIQQTRKLGMMAGKG